MNRAVNAHQRDPPPRHGRFTRARAGLGRWARAGPGSGGPRHASPGSREQFLRSSVVCGPVAHGARRPSRIGAVGWLDTRFVLSPAIAARAQKCEPRREAERPALGSDAWVYRRCGHPGNASGECRRKFSLESCIRAPGISHGGISTRLGSVAWDWRAARRAARNAMDEARGGLRMTGGAAVACEARDEFAAAPCRCLDASAAPRRAARRPRSGKSSDRPTGHRRGAAAAESGAVLEALLRGLGCKSCGFRRTGTGAARPIRWSAVTRAASITVRPSPPSGSTRCPIM